jgi:hypothetical protein
LVQILSLPNDFRYAKVYGAIDSLVTPGVVD